MAFVDELKIYARAGTGGDGVVRWLHQKFKEYGGPSGGNGGRGGDVYAVGVRDIYALEKYPAIKKFLAQNGEAGRKNEEEGKNGDVLEIAVPVGSIITNLKTKERFEITAEGERALMLKGGAGGLGNAHFKSSTNRAPEDATEGKRGEDAEFHIELQLIADAGLVGFPNAGKSSLLNELTNATAKIGAYPFTTLEPNLGSLFGFILADIPGLIEGASTGRGLGHKFLRHIERTKMLVHAISLENEDVCAAYDMFMNELAQFDETLLQKEQLVVLTKSDIVTPERAEEARKQIAPRGHDVVIVSAYDDASVKALSDALVLRLRGHES